MPFIGTQPEVGGYSVLDALTASATASYTLQLNSANFVPNSANQLLVSLNGVIQKPGSSFTLSGSTLSFSSALSSSDSIDFILSMGQPLLVGTPSDGTVTASKVAAGAIGTTQLAGSIPDSKIAALAASKLTGALPAISGASLTGLSAGIEMADQWRLTTSFTANANPITSNWERNDSTGYGALGTGMTNSGGTFTFPSTGVYHIGFQVLIGSAFASGAHSQGCWIYIRTTTNNSSYANAAHNQQGIYNFNTSYFSGGSVYCEAIFDVTDVSTHKVQFGFGAGQGGEACRGSSVTQGTGFTITRLGDT